MEKWAHRRRKDKQEAGVAQVVCMVSSDSSRDRRQAQNKVLVRDGPKKRMPLWFRNLVVGI
ncbi:MAG: hypothetical protein PHW73_04090 [Atribacterota bacterium]|nr:hypothetical protein [Atribacterota bacterium]